MKRPDKPHGTIQRARKLRREMSLPEVLLWQHLRGSPNGIRFRRQHPAGPYVLDFFCARANLAVEVDGFAHDVGDRPQRDQRRDEWLARHRVDTLRIAAKDVLNDAEGVAQSVLAVAQDRLARFGKSPPSDAGAPATSPSQGDGEDYL